jgi:hypothetical protein
MENELFLIFQSQYLNLINFEEVLETSIETTRKSLDRTKTFVKWDTPQIPSSVLSIPEPKQIVDYYTICEILETEEWIKKFNL